MSGFFSKRIAPILERVRWRFSQWTVDGSGRPPFSVNARLLSVGGIIVGGLGVLVAKLYYEQVIRHEYWAAKIRKGSEVTVRIPAVRGEIRDRNGVTLARNGANYTIEFYLPDIVRDYREAVGKVPMLEYQTKVRQMKKVQREPDIVQIVNESLMPQLEQLGLVEDYNSQRLQRHFRHSREMPFTYRDDVDFATVAKFSQRGTGLPGVEIATKPVRRYPYGALAAHILGYVGAVKDIEKQPDINDFTFYDPDVEGKSQVEHYYDQWLRGAPGARILQRNPKGVIEGETGRVDPKPGNNVYLTIDARIQFIVERALRESGIGRGSAVVVNPQNGEILALASVPSYDPNTFIPSIGASDWKKLTDDGTDPLTNRAVQGYAPGSTYKTVTALAGLRAGIPVTRKFNCTGGVQYGNKYMKCWIAGFGTHGALTLPDALKTSCNAFFYQWGNAAGIDQIDAVGEMLGLGKRTGAPLSGESGGVLPGPGWLQMTHPGERWSDGHTANVSIGQGYVLASPLQMAMVTATIANGGIAFEPRLVLRVLDPAGQDVRNPETGRLVVPPKPKIHADLRESGVTDAQIEAVREGMRRVVADGTGKRAQMNGVSVAGKSGTAQFWRGDIKDNHAWFIAFAPYEKPQYALCVMVQGARSGGSVSAPIVRRILDQCLLLGHDYNPDLSKMAPAVGSFAQIDSVDYKQGPKLAATTAPAESNTKIIPTGIPVPFDATSDDPETLYDVDAPPRAVRVEPSFQRHPDIRNPADSRGRVLERPATTERGDLLKPFFAPSR